MPSARTPAAARCAASCPSWPSPWGFFVLAIIVVIVLRLIVGSQADSVADQIQKLLGK